MLSPFSEVLKAFANGEMVIIVDDENRENEGDITVATQCLTEKHLQFMMREARGLICVSIGVDRAEKLNLPLQVINNSSPFNTPFLVSIDHKDVAGSGINLTSRLKTIHELVSDSATAQDFTSPGHVFPLAANPQGVVARRGQTEGSYDLAKLAGLKPSGVICEILNPDGTMMRGQELEKFAQKHSLKITSVEEILRYRVNKEILVHQVAERELSTKHGKFKTYVFEDDFDAKEHLVLVHGNLSSTKAPLVRIHSECLTGDVFGSKRCDCGLQLDVAMEKIIAEPAGVILYLRQEGRGIGLANKLKAYALQEQGHDTVEANLKLGFAADERDFAVAAKILELLGVSTVRLMTNNPDKVERMNNLGVKVQERVPHAVTTGDQALKYLKTKKEKLGHFL